MAEKILIKTVQHAPEEVPTLYTHAEVMRELGRAKQQRLARMPLPVARVQFGGNLIGLWTRNQIEQLRAHYGSTPRPMKRRSTGGAEGKDEDNG